ncbi:MAG TPA: secretin N-terminal domain-containing protein [Gemmatimonadaceae bacterium]
MVLSMASVVRGQAVRAPDSVTVRIQSTDLRAAVEIMQQYLDKPVIFSATTNGPAINFETPRAVPRADVPRLLRALLDAQGFELVDDTVSGTYRARQRDVTHLPMGVAPSLQPIPTDARRQTTPPELFVIALKHARAADVAATINALFGRAVLNSTNTSAGPRSPTLADDLRNSAMPPVDSAPTRTPSAPIGRSAALVGELVVVPEPRGNSLLLRTTRADYELIRSAVEQIDVRAPQVLIEVLIVEARRDRSFDLSVEASIADHHLDHTENSTLGGSFTPASAGLGDFTLHVMGVGGWDVDATIRAAVRRGDVKIISRPTVLAANDQEAEVNVGSQRPFVQVSRTLPTDAGVRDQVVQYRDVGTRLNVRPTISVDGTVALAVTQEVSSATNETAFDAPIISTRSVKTDLLVQDGQTIVLGGLTDRQHEVDASGLPLLSRIPFIGGLFGSQSRATAETELFLFLTPRVIRSDEDARRLTDPLRARAKVISP